MISAVIIFVLTQSGYSVNIVLAGGAAIVETLAWTLALDQLFKEEDRP